MASEAILNIYPYPLTNPTITGNGYTLTPSAGNNCYYFSGIPAGTWTVSADDYNSSTVTVTGTSYTDSYSVTLTAGTQYVSKLSNGTTTYTIKDTNAYHQGDLATVATSGSYNDLVNKPTIGTGTLTIQRNSTTVDTFNANTNSDKTINITVPTTASEIGGIVANPSITGATHTKITYDSKGLVTSGTDLTANDIPALPITKISDATITVTELNRLSGVTSNVQTQINTINGKIPAAATTSNQLADKDFVNSTVTTLLSRYVTSNVSGDSFATYAALVAGPYYIDGVQTSTSNLHINDYVMLMADETHDGKPARYVWSGSQWSFQYVLNTTTFTQAQVNALNSGITSGLVSDYNTHILDTDVHVTTNDKNTWNSKQAEITGAATTITSSNLTASRALVSDSSGKVAASSVTSTELGYVSGVTSAIQTQLSNKQATLVSGTNIKSVNGTTLLGSGDLSTYPSQAGNSGKYLTTNGTSVSWATVDALPSQTSQSGKFLTTNGTTASWANIPNEIPSQSGNSGKFLTTNGSAVSWATVDTLPSQTSQSGKFLTTNGSAASWASLATVATSGSYNDLSNKLTAGTDITISSNQISCTYPEVYISEEEYRVLVDSGSINPNTYYNTDDATQMTVTDFITKKDSMNPGDQLPQGYLVFVEVQ